MRWVVRDYREGDEDKILSLFALVFGEEKKRTRDFWRWLYRSNPAGDPVIGLAFDRASGALVSHGAVIPLAGLLRGRPVRFGLAMDAMTHPAFRGAVLGRHGAFLLLARHVIRRIAPQMPFAYGFPGDRHLRLGSKELDYLPVGQPPVLRRAVDPPARFRERSAVRLHRVRSFRSFGSGADALWEKVRGDYPFSLVRDSRYLNWRYRDHPTHRYHFSALTGLVGRWAGWMVLGIEGQEARIVDLLLPRKLPPGSSELVERGIEAAARMGAMTIAAYMPASSPGRSLLERLGFREEVEEGEALLAVRLHDPSVRLEEVAAEFHYQMGDSDMF